MSKLNSFNPSNGSLVWSGNTTDAESISAFVQAALRIQPEWASRTVEERELILREFAEVLKKRTLEIATLISKEIGKPLWESKTEVAAMVGKVDISIRAHRERCSEFVGGKAVTRFRPHGVVAVIGPYNFPGHLPNGHICPALLAGNTVVFKPSELAPATGDLLFDCWMDAGLPKDVLQIVQGGPEASINLISNQNVNGVFFTGSASTGKKLLKQFTDDPGKILALEMGGNNPLIIDADNISNLEAAVEITLNSAFISAGQRCTCARRLVLIESESANNFLDKLIEKTKSITVDDPFADPEPFIGPLASPEFPQQVCQRQDSLILAGAIPLLKASPLKPGTGFISPGILDVSDIENLPDEEIFAPILQIIRVIDLDEAIKTANNTRYGLASGLLSDDRSRYDYAYPRLKAGIINWNTQLTGASSAAPFGGIKDSGNNRPSAFFAADYCSYPVASIESPVCE